MNDTDREEGTPPSSPGAKQMPAPADKSIKGPPATKGPAPKPQRVRPPR